MKENPSSHCRVKEAAYLLQFCTENKGSTFSISIVLTLKAVDEDYNNKKGE